MNLGGPELLIVIVLLGFVIPLWGILDAAVRPDSQWTAASQNKVAWILLQVFLGVIGTGAYFLAIRPKLVAAAAQSR
jgi:hypothetical protein